ncbi:hypothetical protein [uncultured Flavobacterium sp.]|uniref:hypothetical protein n=1 Tax=uncultured Flavobacterium sp. TaxID=165435 RepID=UPI0025F96D36|nr:hypothetical protein [uncultured Flavobacterium sp.]
MKKLIAIAALAISQFALAQSAGNRPDAISPKAMEAYELKAESKAAEFFSYLELLTDPNANAEMKAQAAAEASKLFQNDRVTLENIFGEGGEIATVKKLLELASAQKKKTGISIASVSVMPRKENPGQREWMITYDLIVGKKTFSVSQMFMMLLEEKKFGNTKKMVWNSYLGEMRRIK